MPVKSFKVRVSGLIEACKIIDLGRLASVASTFYKLNKRGNCHENCRQAEADGLGLRVSGWYVMNEFTHDGFADGMCRLVHHSNLMLADGSLLNITSDDDANFHIFIQDEARDFDFDNRIGYNDRMVFGDSFLVGRSVPRNKVHFAAKGELSRDISSVRLNHAVS